VHVRRFKRRTVIKRFKLSWRNGLGPLEKRKSGNRRSTLEHVFIYRRDTVLTRVLPNNRETFVGQSAAAAIHWSAPAGFARRVAATREKTIRSGIRNCSHSSVGAPRSEHRHTHGNVRFPRQRAHLRQRNTRDKINCRRGCRAERPEVRTDGRRFRIKKTSPFPNGLRESVHSRRRTHGVCSGRPNHRGPRSCSRDFWFVFRANKPVFAGSFYKLLPPGIVIVVISHSTTLAENRCRSQVVQRKRSHYRQG